MLSHNTLWPFDALQVFLRPPPGQAEPEWFQQIFSGIFQVQHKLQECRPICFFLFSVFPRRAKH